MPSVRQGDARQRLLELRLNRRAGVAAPGIRPREGSSSVPLSLAQEGLWFLDQLSGPGVYTVTRRLRLRGALDLAALERSLRALVQRHESLRTAIRVGDDGAPMQWVQPPDQAAKAIELTTRQVGGLDEAAREAALRDILQADAVEAFDLSRAPLFRARLLRLTAADHVLVVLVHHIVADGWSMGVLMRELATLYSSGGDTGALPALPIQFGDYAVWQRRRVAGESLDRQIDYWRLQLSGLEQLELPTDYPRPARASHRGAIEDVEVRADVVVQLRALARRENVTLFMVLLAAFDVLLLRYSRQSDLAVGVPVAGRSSVAVEGLVGCFINTVVVRCSLSGNPRFVDLLPRVREATLGALANQEVPFDRLVAELKPRRDLSRNPLYQVAFALHNERGAEPEFDGLHVQPIELQSAAAKYDLLLSLGEVDGSLRGGLEYAVDLFDRGSMSRLAKHFNVLLEAIAAEPERPIAQLQLLSEAERTQILVEWNRTAQAYSLDQCLHELVQAQARRSPDAIAAVFEGRQITFRCLNTQANRLARELRTRGVDLDAPVGVLMERSVELVVGLLAVLKAGCGFVPLDPDYPPDRLAFMLEDSQVRIVVTQPQLRGRLTQVAARSQATAIWVCPIADASPMAEEFDLPNASTPDSLAYAIYTSGSTGRPKGALIPHRAVVNHVLWLRKPLHLTHADRVLHKTPISFDASIWEIFAPLTVGATVVVARPGAHRDMAELARTLADHSVTILQVVPSALRLLLEEPGLAQCSKLRYVVSGGEALDVALARQFHQVMPAATLGNFYGPSEAGDDATWYEIDAALADRPSVPIGRPIGNVICRILDPEQQLVPVGVPGELHIGGAGLARGYLNRPELTAQRFVDDPFQARGRLYRTGDLARYLPEGTIEFLGRLDNQVKLRGQRVELGEIEARLNACPGVRQCAVVLREDRPGLAQLVAYAVAEPIALAALPDRLRAELPEYMLPSAILGVSELPLLPNGKLDRNALAAPKWEGSDRGDAAPRSQIEEALVEIWGGVLPASIIGVHDNFFDLGGHSLMATRIVSRCRNTFQTDLSLRTLFEYPTIAEFAKHIIEPAIDRERRAASRDQVIQRVDRTAALPASFSQRRMWLLQQLEPEGVAYNIALAYRLRGELDREALVRALELVTRRHEAFRTTLVMADDGPVQVIGPEARAVIDRVDLHDLPSAQREAEAMRRAGASARVPFDLAAGPLHRFTLFRLDDTDHVLMLLLHHAVCDEWAVGIVLRELSTAYRAQRLGRSPDWPALSIDCADYAVWQRSAYTQEALRDQVAYWRDRLSGLLPLNLPFDHVLAAPRSSRGAQVHAAIPDSTIAALRQVSARHSVTPFMTLLACFQALLARYCAQEDIAVGAPIANRTALQTETLVGALVNTLVMRTDLSGDPTFAALLGRVRATALAAYSHQDVPFDYLVKTLRTATGRHTQIQVLFNLLNSPRERFELDGLDCSFVTVDAGATQFDLSLQINIDTSRRAALTFATDLFERSTAQRLLDAYFELLEQALAGPDKPLFEYRAAPHADVGLVARCNDTAEAYDTALCVHKLVEAQMRRTPHAPALSQPGAQALTYAELDSRANRLAHALRGRGVGRGALVGLCLERGVDMVVALLAILRAGGAYVPLDPSYPADRLAFMVDDARLVLSVSQSSQGQLLELPRERLVLLDADAETIAAQPDSACPADCVRDAGAEDPAYVIYTSGSTGRPKGVVVPHRAVVNILLSTARRPGLQAHDRLVAVTMLSFDISVLELLLPLTVGAQVVLATRAHALHGDALRDLLEHSEATVMQATPTTWQMLIDAGWAGTPKFKALIGGEALPPDLAGQLLTRTAELWNMYGPTETTVWSTCWRVESPERAISIGRPIANTQVHVLDQHRKPCPIGVPGEIHIGGDGVALGYLRRPELDAERFVPDPFAPGRTLYRTGDRGRWRQDGLLEHQGRLDLQVKVRGHRIELGEIEANLASHARVARVVVGVREGRHPDTRLVAYVVARGSAPSADELRDHLRVRLPDYMLPQHFVSIDALPLMPNGKVDRLALPALCDIREQDAAPESVAPHTDAEIAVAEIWAQLLGVESISAFDNFFDLGGHSLLAVRAIGQIQNRLGFKVGFDQMTTETLAQIAATASRPAAGAPGTMSARWHWLSRLKSTLRRRTVQRDPR